MPLFLRDFSQTYTEMATKINAYIRIRMCLFLVLIKNKNVPMYIYRKKEDTNVSNVNERYIWVNVGEL